MHPTATLDSKRRVLLPPSITYLPGQKFEACQEAGGITLYPLKPADLRPRLVEAANGDPLLEADPSSPPMTSAAIKQILAELP